MADEIPANQVISIRLKRYQLQMFGYVAFLYYLTCFLNTLYAIIDVFADDAISQYPSYIESVLKEILLFTCLNATLIIFRPREEWPEFYGIGLEFLNNILAVQVGSNRRAAPVPMLKGFINDEDVFDNNRSNFEDDCLARRSSRLSLMCKDKIKLV